MRGTAPGAAVGCGMFGAEAWWRPVPAPALLGVAFAVLAAPAVWWQVAVGSDADDPAATHAPGVAGLLIAGIYMCALLILLCTPLRAGAGRRVRAAGTDGADQLPGRHRRSPASGGGPRPSGAVVTTVVLTIVGVVLAAQWTFSTLWLRRHVQGSLEWLWRWATWARRPPLRR
ncbi:hypothetical protein GCM10009609_70370 [Pseudonocardia aurantiaca]